MGGYQATVAVLTPHVQVLADLGGNTYSASSSNAQLDQPLAKLLNVAAQVFDGAAEGTVILAHPRGKAWAVDGTRSALDAGWQFTKNTVSGWTTFRHGRRPQVHLCLIDQDDPKRVRATVPRSELLGGDDWSTVARRLATYHELTGVAFRMTPGVSACASVRGLYTDHRKGKQPYWGSGRVRPIGDMARGAGDLQGWERDPNLAELGRAFVHVYDANRARLAAAGNAELAWGALVDTGPRSFDPGVSGYWHIRMTKAVESLGRGIDRPPLFDLADARDGFVWLTTPVMRYLMDKGINPEVIASRTGEGRAVRILRGFAEDLNAAVMRYQSGEPDPVVLWAIKASYRELFGMMARDGGSIFRWDWSDTTLDLGRVNILRRADKVHEVHGIWPIRVHTDALYYASDEPDPAKAFPELVAGVKLGQFKLSTIPMVEWQDGRRR